MRADPSWGQTAAWRVGGWGGVFRGQSPPGLTVGAWRKPFTEAGPDSTLFMYL